MSLLLLLSAAQAQPLVAIVVVDQEAREQGYTLEIDGWVVEDALPVDVAEGEQVVLVEPDGRTEPLDVAAGEAWEIVGAKGEAWMSQLDKEVRTDLIAVRGTLESVEALAESLDAQILEEDGLIWLSRKDILFDAPWVEDAEAAAVDEVSLVRVDEPEEPTPDRADPVATRPVGVRGPTVDPVATAVAATPIAPSVDLVATVPEPEGVAEPDVEPEADVPEKLALGAVDAVDDDALRANYAGLYLCRDDVLWLDPAGTYSLRGVAGVWTVQSPGVVRMLTAEGEVLFRAAIQPNSTTCRAVWTPEETGDAMPEGYERLSIFKKKQQVD